ncbi:MAG: hypothetical protein ACI4S9_01400 [Christensenellales bacterium]
MGKRKSRLIGQAVATATADNKALLRRDGRSENRDSLPAITVPTREVSDIPLTVYNTARANTALLLSLHLRRENP